MRSPRSTSGPSRNIIPTYKALLGQPRGQVGISFRPTRPFWVNLWAKSEYHSDLQGPSGSTSGPSRNIIPTYKALLGQPLDQVGISFRPTRPFWPPSWF